MPDAPKATADDFIEAMNRLCVKLDRLADDLGRIYGRDGAGRLSASAPQDGGPAPMPQPRWTPKDVKDVLGKLFGEDEPPKRRRR